MKPLHLLTLIIFLICFLFVWNTIQPPTGQYKFPDNNDGGYLDIAHNVSQHGCFGYAPDKPTAYRMPLFPLIAASIIASFGQEQGPLYLEILQRIFLLSACGITFYVVATHLNKWWGLMALGLLLIDPFFYEHGTRFTLTAGSLFLMSVLLLFFTKIRYQTSLMIWIFFGLFLSVATLYRQTFVAISGAIFLTLFLTNKKKIAFTLLISFTAGMLPWWIRNHVTFNDFVLTCTNTPWSLMSCYHLNVISDLNYLAEFGFYFPNRDIPIYLDDEFLAVSQPLTFVKSQLSEISLFQFVLVESIKLIKFFYPYCHVTSKGIAYFGLFFIKLGQLIGLLYLIKNLLKNRLSVNTNNNLLIICFVIFLCYLAQALIFYSSPRINYSLTPCLLVLSLTGLHHLIKDLATEKLKMDKANI